MVWSKTQGVQLLEPVIVETLNTRPRGGVGFACHVYLLRCCVLFTILVDHVRSRGHFTLRRFGFQLHGSDGPRPLAAREIRRENGDSPIQDQGHLWALGS